MSPRPITQNTLFYGDNLDILRRKIGDETIDLCYIDPPFNSKRNYNQIYNNIGGEDRAQAQAFIDTWVWDDRANAGYAEIQGNDSGRFTVQMVDLIKGLKSVLKQGSLLAYLVSMALRITEIHRVLKPTGSFYLHCDPTANHYLKLVVDAIFVSQGGNYLNEIIWKRTSAHNDPQRYGANIDVILFYTKGQSWTWNTLYTPHDPEYISRFRNKDLNGRLWTDDNLTAKGLSGGGYEYEYKGVRSLWRCPKETMERLDAEGKLHFTSAGGIRLKRYLDENQGVPLQALWTDIPPINSQARERLGYPTQKPEALMERIIKASSNEGDWILDAYCGCGTTVAVAQRLNRNWIGIDITYQSISLILRRLEQQHGKSVVDSIILDGIPQDVESAYALAHKQDDRVRKEFEKWAVLTYTNNRAIINDKKGGDQGIDGTGFFLTGENITGKNENAKIVFQVKSGAVGRGDVSKFNNDRMREGAELGVFITLLPPTQGMRTEAHAAGDYEHTLMSRRYPRIQIVTIQEIVEQNKRLDIPMSLDVLKKSQATVSAEQPSLFDAAVLSGRVAPVQTVPDVKEAEMLVEVEEEEA